MQVIYRYILHALYITLSYVGQCQMTAWQKDILKTHFPSSYKLNPCCHVGFIYIYLFISPPPGHFWFEATLKNKNEKKETIENMLMMENVKSKYWYF